MNPKLTVERLERGAIVYIRPVGAIFRLEASRLARNGREWHRLIEPCGMTGTVIVDPDGIYDPAMMNDRLLLGMKGTMSEFALNLLRQRSAEAIRQKALRGESQFNWPAGYAWTAAGEIGKEPDLRVRHALYAFGRTKTGTGATAGRGRKTVGRKQPRIEWTVLIPEHHPGYISWEQYERNQATMAANVHMKSRAEPKAGRGGRALLSGMLRCLRCGRMLYADGPAALRVSYSGSHGMVLRYQCRGAPMNLGDPRCITFSGLAAEAAATLREQVQQPREAVELELAQARYEAKLSARRKEILPSLAQDLPAVWNSPGTEAGLKRRIVRKRVGVTRSCG